MATKKLSRSKSTRKPPTKKPAVRSKRPARTTRTQRPPKPRRARSPAVALEASVRREQRGLVSETQRLLREAGIGRRRGTGSKARPKRPGRARAKRQLH